MKKVSTTRGDIEMNEEGDIVFSQISVRTLFCLGLALKTSGDGRLLEYSREEILRISHWIWALLFEWSVEHSENTLSLYKSDDKCKWNYQIGCMRLEFSRIDYQHPVRSVHSFDIPLPMLGRRAASLVCQKMGKKTNSLVTKSDSFEICDRKAIEVLSLSTTTPRWAFHNPYASFPANANGAWDGRGEFSGDDAYSLAMDLAQKHL